MRAAILIFSTITLATATTNKDLGYLRCASSIARTYQTPQSQSQSQSQSQPEAQCTSPSALDCFCNAPFDPSALDQATLDECAGEGVEPENIPAYICDDANVPVSPRKGSVPMVRIGVVEEDAAAAAAADAAETPAPLRGSLPMVRVGDSLGTEDAGASGGVSASASGIASASASASASVIASASASVLGGSHRGSQPMVRVGDLQASSSAAASSSSLATPTAIANAEAEAAVPRRASRPMVRLGGETTTTTMNQPLAHADTNPHAQGPAQTQAGEAESLRARAYSPNLHPDPLLLPEDVLPLPSDDSVLGTAAAGQAPGQAPGQEEKNVPLPLESVVIPDGNVNPDVAAAPSPYTSTSFNTHTQMETQPQPQPQAPQQQQQQQQQETEVLASELTSCACSATATATSGASASATAVHAAAAAAAAATLQTSAATPPTPTSSTSKTTPTTLASASSIPIPTITSSSVKLVTVNPTATATATATDVRGSSAFPSSKQAPGAGEPNAGLFQGGAGALQRRGWGVPGVSCLVGAVVLLL
ncbi:extracellular serine rich protein [Aspergillus aculeatinus CBS 121060]|uniref:Uncharacterized protein n=1 Tax=Aspergillus aculeatinus CBS 121060 TaxID=1448322 RepID=A0ACD1HGP6_9EURO|nr:hypothetical protein BO66DRAFT_435739 [Aspergillus aculeatinus CBS 121060]RAH72832.1 hypothetical protein BO66DRAFT_435739 [Aspergillus aculeatinus CBS 121060]